MSEITETPIENVQHEEIDEEEIGQDVEDVDVEDDEDVAGASVGKKSIPPYGSLNL